MSTHAAGIDCKPDRSLSQATITVTVGSERTLHNIVVLIDYSKGTGGRFQWQFLDQLLHLNHSLPTPLLDSSLVEVSSTQQLEKLQSVHMNFSLCIHNFYFVSSSSGWRILDSNIHLTLCWCCPLLHALFKPFKWAWGSHKACITISIQC